MTPFERDVWRHERISPSGNIAYSLERLEQEGYEIKLLFADLEHSGDDGYEKGTRDVRVVARLREKSLDNLDIGGIKADVPVDL